eukprot:178900-Rhodomonas_salina.1
MILLRHAFAVVQGGDLTLVMSDLRETFPLDGGAGLNAHQMVSTHSEIKLKANDASLDAQLA